MHAEVAFLKDVARDREALVLAETTMLDLLTTTMHCAYAGCTHTNHARPAGNWKATHRAAAATIQSFQSPAKKARCASRAVVGWPRLRMLQQSSMCVNRGARSHAHLKADNQRVRCRYRFMASICAWTARTHGIRFEHGAGRQ